MPTKFQALHLNKNKIMLQNLRGLWIFLKISSSQNYPYSLPLFQRYYYHPIYSPFFHHLLKLIILLLPRKVVGTSFPRFKSNIMFGKESPNHPNSRLLREGEGRRWKKTSTWWPMEGSKVQWPLKGSNVWWPMEGEGETSFSHLFTFPPTNFT